MAQKEILEAVRKLTTLERLETLEAILHFTREDLQSMAPPPPEQIQRKNALSTAARALLPAYEAGGELTLFTQLDGDLFHE